MKQHRKAEPELFSWDGEQASPTPPGSLANDEDGHALHYEQEAHRRTQNRLLMLRQWLTDAIQHSPHVEFRYNLTESRFNYLGPVLAEWAEIELELLKKYSGDDLCQLIHPADQETVVKQFNALLDLSSRKRRSFEVEFRLRDPEDDDNGKSSAKSLQTIWLHLSGSLLDDGDTRRLVGSAIDITGLKQVEERLRQSEERYRDLHELLPHGVFSNDTDGRLLYANPSCVRMFGFSSLADFNESPPDAIHEDPEKLQELQRKLLEDGHYDNEVWKAVRKNGSRFWAESSARLVTDSEGHPIRFEGNVRDVTARIEHEEELTRRARFEHTLAELAGILLVGHGDETALLTQALQRLCDITGTMRVVFFRNVKGAEGTFFHAVSEACAPDVPATFSKLPGDLLEYGPSLIPWKDKFLRREVVYDHLSEWQEEEQRLFPVDHANGMAAFPVHGNGEWFGFICFFEVETAPPLSMLDERVLFTAAGIIGSFLHRSNIEGQLRQSLQEKDLFLRELNHRVKNNLQMISSMLDMQGREVKDDSAREAFRQSRNRIQSIATLHERLQHADRHDSVDFGRYMEDLISALVLSYQVDEEQIDIQLQLSDDIRMDVDAAIPTGQILVELVSNCFKHAFPDGVAGKVFIELNRKKDEIDLAVHDSGVGLEENDTEQHLKSLGLRLVRLLTDQLDGTMTLQGDNGTRVEIRFPLKKSTANEVH